MSETEDQTTPQNPISEENSIPASPQEPTEPAPENAGISEPTEVPSEAPESSPSDFEVKSNNIPPSNSTFTEQGNEQNNEEKPSENETQIEPISELKSEPVTAQTSTNEPLTETGVKPVEVEILELQPSHKNMSELLAKEHLAIQNRKRKRLDGIMNLFLKNPKITNDEVEKFLHVSDATATRYLTQLEQEGKIKKNEKSGKKGKWVSYSRI